MRKLSWKSDETRLIELALAQHNSGNTVDSVAITEKLPERTAVAIHNRLHILRRAGQLPRDMVLRDPTVRQGKKGERISPSEAKAPVPPKEGETEIAEPSAGESEVVDKLFAIIMRLLEQNHAAEEASHALRVEIKQLQQDNTTLKLRVGELETVYKGPDPSFARGVQIHCTELVDRFAAASRSDRQTQLDMVKGMLIAYIDLLSGLANFHALK